jgi:hypothetical protein
MGKLLVFFSGVPLKKHQKAEGRALRF